MERWRTGGWRPPPGRQARRRSFGMPGCAFMEAHRGRKGPRKRKGWSSGAPGEGERLYWKPGRNRRLWKAVYPVNEPEKYLARAVGLEPATNWLTVICC